MEPKLKNIKIAECTMESKTVSLFRNHWNNYTMVVSQSGRKRPSLIKTASRRIAIAEYMDCVESTISNFLS